MVTDHWSALTTCLSWTVSETYHVTDLEPWPSIRPRQLKQQSAHIVFVGKHTFAIILCAVSSEMLYVERLVISEMTFKVVQVSRSMATALFDILSLLILSCYLKHHDVMFYFFRRNFASLNSLIYTVSIKQVWCSCSLKTVWPIPQCFRGELIQCACVTEYSMLNVITLN